MTAPRIVSRLAPSHAGLTVRVHAGQELTNRISALSEFVNAGTQVYLSHHPKWLPILAEGLGHVPYALEAIRAGKTVGYLGLADVKSLLFGRFLVSLPYLNYGGVLTEDMDAASALIDGATRLASDIGARYLELRHEWAIEHPALAHRRTDKVHMRLDLPGSAGILWDRLSAKVRNQIRKAKKGSFSVHFGARELLDEFHDVFSRNMRDLGTPVFGRKFFESILRHFPDRAEFCVVRDGCRPVAAALLLHGWGVSEVPSASSLRSYNSSCVNMLMYWQLLERAVLRGQDVFDFGRSSEDSATFRFKKQWGATSCPAEWQYHLLRGDIGEMRADSPKYRRLVRIWQRMPLWLTRTIGPRIVRGIP